MPLLASNFINQTSYDLGPAGSGVYYYSLGLDIWLNAKYDLGEKSSFVASLLNILRKIDEIIWY